MLIPVTIDARAVPAGRKVGADEPAIINSRFLVSISEEFLKAPDYQLEKIRVRRVILSVGVQSIEVYVKEEIEYFRQFTGL